jgi:hypothetical protein
MVMNQHSPGLDILARERLDARRVVDKEKAVQEMRRLQQSIEADLETLKAMAAQVRAQDTSFVNIESLLEETCTGIEHAIRED